MSFRLFILAAVVMAVFGVIASAVASGTCLGVTYSTWVIAALLAYFVDCLVWDTNARTYSVPRRVVQQ